MYEELIAVDVDINSCVAHPLGNCVFFDHPGYEHKCNDAHHPCRNRPQIFFIRTEYAAWRLTGLRPSEAQSESDKPTPSS